MAGIISMVGIISVAVQMSLPSHISQVVKSLSFHIPEARKKVPLSDGAPGGTTNFAVSLECSDLQSANSS